MPGATNTKLHSRGMGSRAPTGPKPIVWIMVAIPVTSRQPATRMVISDALSPTPLPMSRGTGSTLNTRTTICWRLRGMDSPTGGHSFSVYPVGIFFTVFSSISL